MEILNDDRRRERRIIAMWKAHLNENLPCFLNNLSQSGLKLWIDKGLELPRNSVSIQIDSPPVRFLNDKIHFELEVVWVNPEQSDSYNEIGCQFQGLSEQQHKQLRELLIYFYNIQSKGKFY